MGFTSSRYACTISAEKKGVKFFFKFFFVGCGCSGVGARVWVRGSVGGGGGMRMGRAGWRRDGDGVARIGRRVEPRAVPHPGFGLAARV